MFLGLEKRLAKKRRKRIRIVQKTKKFDNFIVVDNISFEIKKGEAFGLLGSNDAGKTTVISYLCGLEKPDK